MTVIYVKDAVEFLNSKNFAVQLGAEKLVAFISLLNIGQIAENTQDIFNKGSAPEDSGIFVISADINSNDFTLMNFAFHFEQIACLPPLQRISNLNEFRASMILCKQATLCSGYEGRDKTGSSSRSSRGRKPSSSCNVVAYPHRGSCCIHCKNVRGKYTPTHHLTSQDDILNDVLEETLRLVVSL